MKLRLLAMFLLACDPHAAPQTDARAGMCASASPCASASASASFSSDPATKK
jgi:hypothetical protein